PLTDFHHCVTLNANSRLRQTVLRPLPDRRRTKIQLLQETGTLLSCSQRPPHSGGAGAYAGVNSLRSLTSTDFIHLGGFRPLRLGVSFLDSFQKARGAWKAPLQTKDSA